MWLVWVICSLRSLASRWLRWVRLFRFLRLLAFDWTCGRWTDFNDVATFRFGLELRGRTLSFVNWKWRGGAHEPSD